MKIATCISESVYSEALTYGKKYTIVEHDSEKGQIKIKGDNEKTRWFPTCYFDLSGVDAPTVKSIWIEAEAWASGQWDKVDDNTDVIVTLSNDTNG